MEGRRGVGEGVDQEKWGRDVFKKGRGNGGVKIGLTIHLNAS